MNSYQVSIEQLPEERPQKLRNDPLVIPVSDSFVPPPLRENTPHLSEKPSMDLAKSQNTFHSHKTIDLTELFISVKNYVGNLLSRVLSTVRSSRNKTPKAQTILNVA